MTQETEKPNPEKIWFRITENQLQELLIHDTPIETVTSFGNEKLKIFRPWNDSFGLGYGNSFDHILTAFATFRNQTFKVKLFLSPIGSSRFYFGHFDIPIDNE